ncbi:MAG: molecular chaperone TorD family protein [Dehalococcoidia bacterium]
MQIDTLTTPEEVTAAARSRLYRQFADGFAYPDRDSFTSLKAGRFRDDTEAMCRALSYDLAPSLDGLVASGDYVDFQAEYLRLFEAGMGIPPCPLYSGLYRGGRKSVMEELTRFYNFFGLSVEQGAGELPDHVTMQLEFMHFLTFKELAALHRGEDASPYRRAQADFLERQLVSWLPSLDARLQGLDPPPFYAALVSLTNAVTQGEPACLRQALAVAEGTAVEG